MQKKMLAIVGTVILTGCSISQQDGALEHWKNYSSQQISSYHLDQKEALAVFYRQGNEVMSPDAVNVYVNGNYQASLLNNTYSAVPVCADRLLFTTSFSSNKKFGNRTQGITQTLPVGDVAYFKVISGKNGSPELVAVDKALAQQEVKSLPKVNQTLSRVTPACGAPVLQSVSLSAGALFPFNKSSYSSILAEGKAQILSFAQDANKLDAAIVDKVVVSGYTDPVGSEKYNDKLSQSRAESVKQALLNNGIKYPVEAIGYGERNLVVSDCAINYKGKKEIAECNLPNRRVEITVYGKK
ncbi:OmpA family protein [Otariodibacter sp.]|uniref:OmpA family protein n=1 Tax=Otariodibacter sp. TaxID=3030919 RepID=UPI00261F56FD|nr:OmpA family protein [Otariodibacter sp.]